MQSKSSEKNRKAMQERSNDMQCKSKAMRRLAGAQP